MAVARIMRTLGAWLGRSLLLLGLVYLTFALFEGISSTLLFGERLLRSSRKAQRYYHADEDKRHSQYDSTLGWVGSPNRSLPDLYGDGRYLRTDSHGFRTDEEISPDIPEDRVRAICTGDSFAFGQGVANNRTWCHLLSALEPTLQTVNMGQRGYGVDQAYLWYRRDGVPLDHQLLLFSFIDADFGRMGRKAHHGYGKPVLRLEDGELTVHNTPVPDFQGKDPLKARVRVALTQLRAVELGRRLVDRSPLADKVTLSPGLGQVVEKLIHDLDSSCRERSVALILIWLPVKREIDAPDLKWRIQVQEMAESLDIPFVDLSVPVRELPRLHAEGFFIRATDGENLEAAGHYNEKGNEWVAQELHSRLLQLEEVQELLLRSNDSSTVATTVVDQK